VSDGASRPVVLLTREQAAGGCFCALERSIRFVVAGVRETVPASYVSTSGIHMVQRGKNIAFIRGLAPVENDLKSEGRVRKQVDSRGGDRR